MLITLTAVALGLGVVTAVLCYLVSVWSGHRPRLSDRKATVAAVVLGGLVTLLVFALALPSTPPFSPGLRLGWGVLIGGVLGVLGALGAAGLARGDGPAPAHGSAFAASVAVVAVALALLLFRDDPAEALLGCALGFGVVAGAVRTMVSAPEVALPMEASGVLAALLAAACLLGSYHYEAAADRGWWAYPLVLAGAWLLAYTIALVLSLRRGWPGRAGAPALAGVLAAVLAAGLGALLAQRLGGERPFLPVVLAGLLVGGLVVWLSHSVAGEEETSAARFRAGALAALLMLFLLAFTFKLQQAFGTGVALAAFAGIAGASALAGWRAAAMPGLVLAAGANYLLLRVFLERGGMSANDVAPDVHYTLVGMLLGVMLPFLYASFRARPGAGRAVLLGMVALGSPVVLAALWGPDAVVGFLGGLVIAPALAAFVRAPAGGVAIVAVGMALVSAQLGKAFQLLYRLPRVDKAYVAGAVALVVVLWIVGLGAAQWRAARAAGQPQEG